MKGRVSCKDVHRESAYAESGWQRDGRKWSRSCGAEEFS